MENFLAHAKERNYELMWTSSETLLSKSNSNRSSTILSKVSTCSSTKSLNKILNCESISSFEKIQRRNSIQINPLNSCNGFSKKKHSYISEEEFFNN